MKKLGIIIIILVVIGVVWYMYSNNANAPTTSQNGANEQSQQTGNTTQTQPTVSAVEVDMTDVGFSPATLTIKTGTTVKFVNKSSHDYWPASGPHPIHTTCPGFDSKGAVKPGDSYSFTFTVAKVCPMHDHLNPSVHGSITVE